MASGFGFIGSKMFGDLSITEQVIENMTNWVNISFLETGSFTDVGLYEKNPEGKDISEMQPIDDAVYGEGVVYQSYFKNFVHETGVVLIDGIDEPTMFSGVYVGGDFYPIDSSGSMAYHVDYPNGRIIFDNQDVIENVYGSGDASVHASFSYKRVSVMTSDKCRQIAVQSSVKNNPAGSGDSFPEYNHVQLPAVIFSSIEDAWLPYELGGHKKARHSVIANVYGGEKYEVDRLVDILSQQQNKKIPSVDWSKSAAQLDEFGDINPEFSGIYASKNIYPWKHLYILNSRGRKTGKNALSGSVSFLVESIYHM